jgi:hypothetical protein
MDAIDELGAAASLVEIFDPHQETAPAFLRILIAKDSAEGVAEVQPSGRRRRKSSHNHCDCDSKDS